MQLVPYEESFKEISDDTVAAKSLDELIDIASKSASSSSNWLGRVRLHTDRRWYERLYQDFEYDVWAISWMPGQSTGFHDHGDSAGAFTVVTGTLVERRTGSEEDLIRPGQVRAFGADYAHDVTNQSLGPAVKCSCLFTSAYGDERVRTGRRRTDSSTERS